MGKRFLKTLVDLPKRLGIWMIRTYQILLSPDHSWLRARFPYGYCRHYPTCSEYTKQAIEKHGLVKGGFLGAKRIVRCNPWVEPSVDPVPKLT